MGNHAAEIRAQNAGLPVLRRGRRFIGFDLGGGRSKTYFTLDPIHLQGTETELDTSWQVDTGAWQWKIASADYQFHARSILNAGNLIEWRVGSQWVIFDPQSINWINQDTSRQQIAIKQAIVGQANDCTLSFPNGYGAGRHFEYTALPTKLVKHFVLDSLSVLPTPTVTGTIWFEAEFTLSTSTGVDLYLDGVKWARTNGVRVRTANQIEFRDAATGTQVLWRAAAPYAEDANGNRVAAEYEVRRSGGPASLFITVRIPRTWLLSAVYPVRIDPTLDLQPDATAGLDVMLYSADPTGNWGTYQGLWIGRETDLCRALIKFDLSSIGETDTVSAADLYLTQYTGSSANATRTLRAFRSKRAWVEAQATYNSYSTGNAWQSAGGFGADDCEQTDIGSVSVAYDQANGTVNDIPLTGATKGDLDLGNGWLLKMDTEANNDQHRYASSDHATAGYRPQLVVVYTAAGGSANLLALLGVG